MTQSGRGLVIMSDALRNEINATFRRRERLDARYQGLVRALLADTSVLWYSTDAELQRDFEAGFNAGMAIKKG